MVFNRHLKALNLCNHSDTIACVLYELLVCLELFNVIFHHDQGSTSFSFVQFSRSCCAVLSRCLAGQLVYNTTGKDQSQHLFSNFNKIEVQTCMWQLSAQNHTIYSSFVLSFIFYSQHQYIFHLLSLQKNLVYMADFCFIMGIYLL